MMKATIIETSFGILAFNEKNELVEKVLFSRKPASAAIILMKIESGKMPDEALSLIESLKKMGYDSFVFENVGLAKDVEKRLGAKVEVSKATEASKIVHSDMARIAVETGFVKDTDEFSLWNHGITMEIAKLRVKSAVEKRDLIIAQAIQTLDDLDKSVNLFMSRVREWYGIHFPELDRLVDKPETYARLVLDLGSRDNFSVEGLDREGIPKEKTEQMARAAKTSMGADLAEIDLKQIQILCKNVMDLFQLRQNLESYLDTAMEEVAPNIKAIVGSLLGARLIAIAGGLTNLAKKPSSTIQVLGAEKALFRSLKTGTLPPKHGIIFQHTLLHDAKKWQRGKIARALAGKLAIAARGDAFGGGYKGDGLKVGLDKRIEEIREKYSEPPPMQERKPQKPRREKRWRKRGRER